MTLTLTLPPELEQRLVLEAERRGIPTEAIALQLLETHAPRPDRNTALIALLQSWIDGEDEEEQQVTGAYLIRALDEDRPSDRKLFPPEMKGISW